LRLADCVLWFASHWATKAHIGNDEGRIPWGEVRLWPGVMICVAAVCLIVDEIGTGSSGLKPALNQEGKIREIEARTKAAKELAGTAGGKGRGP
jgi:hypothetical protein